MHYLKDDVAKTVLEALKVGLPHVQAAADHEAFFTGLGAQNPAVSQCDTIAAAIRLMEAGEGRNDQAAFAEWMDHMAKSEGFFGKTITQQIEMAFTAAAALSAPVAPTDGPPPKGWYETLRKLADNTETFGQYSQETARVAIECCMNALEELEAENAAPVAPEVPQGELPSPWQCETAMCPNLYTADQLRAYAAAAVAQERAECAAVCDQQALEPECPERAQYCADAIRNRTKGN